MNFRRIGLLIASSALLVTSVHDVTAKESNKGPRYTVTDKEYYLSEDVLAFVRPGLDIEILDVTIPDDGLAEVRFKLTDNGNLTLDRDGVTTPGGVSTSFILAVIPEGETGYYSYTNRIQTSPITGDSAEQASSDSGGSYTALDNGEYLYKFGTAVPDDFDADATHTVGIYGNRNLGEFDLGTYYANATYSFVPSGAAEPMPRDQVSDATCSRCHDDQLVLHGQRTGVQLCVLCHNPNQDIDPDTGNSFDMPLMVHKIHMGENLTEDYTIIGYRQSVHNYNDVVYPAAVNDCESCHTGGTTTEDFPLVATPAKALSCVGTGKGSTTFKWDTDVAGAELRLDGPDGKLVAKAASGEVETGAWITDGRKFVLVDPASGDVIQELTMNTTVLGCVGEAPGSPRGEAGVQHTAWLTSPTAKNCGSCHDYVNFETGEGHSSLNLPVDPEDSEACAICHKPDTGEFDRSIRGAHIEPRYQSDQLPGVLVQLDEITNTAPGEFPRVTFTISSKNGPIDPRGLNRLRFYLNGPNEDFQYVDGELGIVERAVNNGEYIGGLTDLGNGLWAYDFETAIPADAEGSWTLAVAGRDVVDINVGGAETDDERDLVQNVTLAFAVTDEQAVARREVTLDANCENCHVNLAGHGGNYNTPAMCNTCHIPEAIEGEGEEAQTFAFKYMIHKIHAGADSETGYVIGNDDLSHVEYPGNLANCAGCHSDDPTETWALPLSDGALGTPTPQEYLAEMEAATAACLSCHDSQDAAAHADANISFNLGESCNTCHGAGKQYDAVKVHAQ